MSESFSACGSLVHTPRGPRKSGIPDSVEIPAPVRRTMRLASSTHERTESIKAVPARFGSDAGAPVSGAQLEPLNLPGRRLRELGKKIYPARILVGREPVLDVLLERRLQGVARGIALLQHHIGLGLDEPVLVFGADHRGFENRVVADQRRFD